MQIAPTKPNMMNVKFTGLAIGYLRPKRWHIVDLLEVFTCFCVRKINGNKTPVDRPLPKKEKLSFRSSALQSLWLHSLQITGGDGSN